MPYSHFIGYEFIYRFCSRLYPKFVFRLVKRSKVKPGSQRDIVIQSHVLHRPEMYIENMLTVLQLTFSKPLILSGIRVDFT